ncbi:MAG: sigma-70 family RNA polymerase sigma factor [Verrucomicrobiota bacterium]
MTTVEELVCEYQKKVRVEKIELLKLDKPRKRMIELLIEFQQPTKQRRLSARTLARLVTHFSRNWGKIEQFFDEVDELRISIDYWCQLRAEAEKLPLEKRKKWQKSFDQTADLRAEVLSRTATIIPRIRSSIVGYSGRYSEDLDSVGYIGLIKAMENFDIRRKVPFEAYARSWIYNSMVQYLRKDQLVNPSEKHLRTFRLYERTFTRLQGELGREPEEIEIANAMNISAQDLENMLAIDTSVTSLDLPSTKDEECSLHEVLGAEESAPYQQMEAKVLARHLRDHMQTLSNHELAIVTLRWFPVTESTLEGCPMTVEQAMNKMREVSLLSLQANVKN